MRWLSGLRQQVANLSILYRVREFESLSHRQTLQKLRRPNLTTINIAMRLYEIEIAHLPEPSKERLDLFIKNSVLIDELSGFDLCKASFENPTQEVYIYTENDEVLGYAILQQGTQYWALNEIWIKNDVRYRRTGLATALIIYVRDLKKQLVLSHKQAPELTNLVKKLIQNGSLTARILDMDADTAIEYRSDTEHRLFDTDHTTLIIEDFHPAQGILSPMSILNYSKYTPHKLSKTIGEKYGIG